MTTGAPGGPEQGGGELAALIAAFESGNPDRQRDAFYTTLGLCNALGRLAADPQDRISAAEEARQLAESRLDAERRLGAERLGAAAAANARLAEENGQLRSTVQRLTRELRGANAEIRDLSQSLSLLGAENDEYAQLLENGEVSPKHVAGFTRLGHVAGGSTVWGVTMGRERAALRAEVRGDGLLITPVRPQPTLDPTIFGAPTTNGTGTPGVSERAQPPGRQPRPPRHERRGKRRH